MKSINKIQLTSTNDESAPGVIRVFLVDDDPSILALLARYLARDPRISVVGSTTDGRKAFHAAAIARADLVLTDLHMPMVDGLEVTRLLKQLQNPPFVFVVTSDDTPEALTRSLSAGADAFLVKAPDLGIQLEMAIQNAFRARHEWENQGQKESYEPLAATR